MRFTFLAVVAFFVVNAVADDHMREAKTANPLIEIHPNAVQPAADVYYKAVEEKVFNGAIPLKYAQLAALSASVAMKCEYCIPAHTNFAIAAGATDEEIKKHKGYTPELNFKNREEILLAIKYVKNVIPSPWLLDMDYFRSSGADFLVHGNDNSNLIENEYLILFERTKDISSTILRKRVLRVISEKGDL